MGNIRLLLCLISSLIVMVTAEVCDTGLQAKVELWIAEVRRDNYELRKRVAELERRDSVLETKVSKLQRKHDSGSNMAFDCFLTDNWDTNGTITFGGCSGTKIQNTCTKIYSS